MDTSLHDPADSGLDAPALDRLQAAIEAEIATGQHHGAAFLVARAGKIGALRGVGHTHLATDRTADVDDIFMLMSVSKAFVAAVVLQLIDHGLLSFDTRIADVIPEFGVRGKQRVTVRHLLNHTGGTYSGFMLPPPLDFARDLGNLSGSVAAVSQMPIANKPGERVVYNPWASYSLLGEVAKRADGRHDHFGGLAAERIFRPLGMNDTSYGLSPKEPRRVPIVMTDTSPGAASTATMESLNELMDEQVEHPPGGAFSTVTDVYRFAEALRGGGTPGSARLLSPAMVDYAYTNSTGDMPNGFWDFNKESRDIPEFPANFTLGGGYARGHGHHLTPLGLLASPRSFGAVGSGSTLWMVDPVRELVFVYFAAGLVEGLAHFQNIQKLCDLALATVV
ncbi:serine hydrolase domain-containing protein [Streptomyces sp. NPDC091217]|uniref:serine hydrolase domain-containing protein n=1 Tax=Streptomyces sp. NPDC091217 TaxID=3365975 RepID=UPI0038106F91